MRRIRWTGQGLRRLEGYVWPEMGQVILIADQDSQIFVDYPRPGQFEDLGNVDDFSIHEMSGLSPQEQEMLSWAGVSVVSDLASFSGSDQFGETRARALQAQALWLLGEPPAPPEKPVKKKSRRSRSKKGVTNVTR